MMRHCRSWDRQARSSQIESKCRCVTWIASRKVTTNCRKRFRNMRPVWKNVKSLKVSGTNTIIPSSWVHQALAIMGCAARRVRVKRQHGVHSSNKLKETWTESTRRVTWWADSILTIRTSIFPVTPAIWRIIITTRRESSKQLIGIKCPPRVRKVSFLS